MENFDFHVTTDIRFGKDRLAELPEVLNQYGKKVLIVYGGGSIKKIGLYDKVMEQLKANGNEVFELAGVEPNPRVETVRRGAEICRKENVDVILAVGGGSTIDCAVISNLATHQKLGTGSKSMLPKVSFLDPQNTFSVNKYQTAAGSADIMSHLIENYFKRTEGTDVQDSVSEGLMRSVIKNCPIALKYPDDYDARANLMNML